MEILTQFWWIAAVLVAGLVIARVRRNHIRKRKGAQYRADDSTIINIYNDFRGGDIPIYKDLPNRAARIEWLKRHYPEFMEATERHFPDEKVRIEGVIAVHLDLRLLTGVHEYESPDSALRTYQTATARKSLNEYQELVDKTNIAQAKWKASQAEAEAKLRAANRERRAKEEAAEKLRKNVAKSYWKSLTKEQKEAFKKAKGKGARKRALPSSVSTGYSLDTLYPLIMATQFNNLNPNTDSSIDYCHSSYTDSGSHSFSDHSSHSGSGSSFSSSDSGGGGCDGGGGGGGD